MLCLHLLAGWTLFHKLCIVPLYIVPPIWPFHVSVHLGTSRMYSVWGTISFTHYLIPKFSAFRHTHLLEMGRQPIILKTKLLCLSFLQQLLDLGTLMVLQLSNLDPCHPSKFLYQLGLRDSERGKLHHWFPTQRVCYYVSLAKMIIDLTIIILD